MTSRTIEQARYNVDNGNLDFKVVMSTDWKDGKRLYVVATPKALMRSGVFGWIQHAITATWGKPTKFGNDLFHTLNAIEGVGPSLDNDMPHILQLSVEETTGKGQFAAMHVAHGLPEVVCVEIEAAILRNDGLIQRLSEWLRRLF